jgi:hypothetical protein
MGRRERSRRSCAIVASDAIVAMGVAMRRDSPRARRNHVANLARNHVAREGERVRWRGFLLPLPPPPPPYPPPVESPRKRARRDPPPPSSVAALLGLRTWSQWRDRKALLMLANVTQALGVRDAARRAPSLATSSSGSVGAGAPAAAAARGRGGHRGGMQRRGTRVRWRGFLLPLPPPPPTYPPPAELEPLTCTNTLASERARMLVED